MLRELKRIQLGLLYAGKTAEVAVECDIYRISVEGGVTFIARRKSSRDMTRQGLQLPPTGSGQERWV